MLRFLFALIAPSAPMATRATMALVGLLAASAAAEMQVKGRYIYDKCGQKLVFRGFEEPFNKAISPAPFAKVPEMGKTGANLLRVVINFNNEFAYTPEEWRQLFRLAIQSGMYVEPAVWGHDPKEQEAIKKREMVDLFNEFRDHLLLEAIGESHFTDEQWRDTCKARVLALRQAGYKCPLSLFSNEAGRNPQAVIKYGQEILDADPLKNVFFVVQGYWVFRKEYEEKIVALSKLPFPVQIGVGTEVAAPWTHPVVHYDWAIELAQQYDMPWMIWCWYLQFGAARSNMSRDGMYGNWQPSFNEWGKIITEESPYGLKKATVRPSFVGKGACETQSIPAAPTGLSVKTGTDRRMDLSWSHPLTMAHGFILERMEAGGPWKPIRKIGRVTFWSDNEITGTAPATSYSYRIKAYNQDAGESGYSNTAQGSTAPRVAMAQGTGVEGQYFTNMDFREPAVFSRTDSALNMGWLFSLPDPRLTLKNYAVRWRGYLVPRYSEEYQFYFDLCGNGRLFIDTTLIFEAGTPWTMEYMGEKLKLEAGKRYPITLELKGEPCGLAQVFWRSASEPYGVIPKSQLFVDADAPSGLVVRPLSASSIRLDWSDRSGAEKGFLVERKAGSEPWKERGTVGANVKTFTDQGLPPASTFLYRVRAQVGAGMSLPTFPASGTSLSGLPTLAEWSFSERLTDTLAPALFLHSHLAAAQVVRGKGLSGGFGPGAEMGSLTHVLEDFQKALLDTNYVEITLTPKVGATLNIDRLAFGTYKGEHRKFGLGLFSDLGTGGKADNFATLLGSKIHPDGWDMRDSAVFKVDLKGINKPIRFRLVMTDDAAPNEYFAQGLRDVAGRLAIQVEGTATGTVSVRHPGTGNRAPGLSGARLRPAGARGAGPGVTVINSLGRGGRAPGLPIGSFAKPRSDAQKP